MHILKSLPLAILAILGCQQPSRVAQPGEKTPTAQRLLRPEQVIIPPEHADWPRPVQNGQFPHYPQEARSTGVEGRVVVAFVIDAEGLPEAGTISILQSTAPRREFASSVCAFLRSDAKFSWYPHAPLRGLVVMPFEFRLNGVTAPEALPPTPNLEALGDSLRGMSPTQLASWIESKPHCF